MGAGLLPDFALAGVASAQSEKGLGFRVLLRGKAIATVPSHRQV